MTFVIKHLLVGQNGSLKWELTIKVYPLAELN